MQVVDAGVVLQRCALEIRLRIELPPLSGELFERFRPSVERCQAAGPLERTNLGLERLRVSVRVERSVPFPPIGLVPPDAVDGVARPISTLTLSSFDHGDNRRR